MIGGILQQGTEVEICKAIFFLSNYMDSFFVD